MIRAVMWETLSGRSVDLLDRFDRGDEIRRAHGLGIEGHDGPADNGVDLRPVNAGDCFQYRLDVTDERSAFLQMRAAHLDVGPPPVSRHGHPPGATPFGI